MLVCLRYIELNPVRAQMASDPSEYRWSSYHANALGVDSKIWTPHSEYLALGKDSNERQGNYRSLFLGLYDEQEFEDLRQATYSSLAFGNKQFKDKLAVSTGRKQTPRKKRPKPPSNK